MTGRARLTNLYVPAGDADVAGARLWAAGAAAIEERGGDDGEHRLLVTVLAADDDTSRARLGELPITWELSFSDDDSFASEAWRSHAGPVTVNDQLEIRPAWLAGAATEVPTCVVIEPGGAFGLGDHPTTRLSADAAWRATRQGDRVLDVGCGTGVLAIVAALRGASQVVAVDVAEAAREATADNAERNGVERRIVASCTPLHEVVGVFDLVLANILAPTIVAMADDLVHAVADGGRVIVSGVLSDRHDHVVEALGALSLVGTTVDAGWACLQFVKR